MAQITTTPSLSWHALSPQEVAAAISTDLGDGLDAEEAVQRQRHEGFNELPEAPPAPPLKLFLSQFTSVIVWVLIGAAVLSGLLDDWLTRRPSWPSSFSTVCLGLSKSFAPSGLWQPCAGCRWRWHMSSGGGLESIPARELVPGDLVVLEAGDESLPTPG